MSSILTATLVISILLGAGLLVVLFCLLAMAQRGDAYQEELERRRPPEKVFKPDRPCYDPEPSYFSASPGKQRGSEPPAHRNKVLST
jgi:hypothetical protein